MSDRWGGQPPSVPPGPSDLSAAMRGTAAPPGSVLPRRHGSTGAGSGNGSGFPRDPGWGTAGGSGGGWAGDGGTPRERGFTRHHAARDGGNGAKHLADVWTAPTGRARALPTRRRWLQWLIVVPTVMALLVPLFNRVEPRLLGLPFFYWYQLAVVLVMIMVVTLVYLLTKGRRPRWTR
jgi:hypothetical protein